MQALKMQRALQDEADRAEAERERERLLAEAAEKTKKEAEERAALEAKREAEYQAQLYKAVRSLRTRACTSGLRSTCNACTWACARI